MSILCTPNPNCASAGVAIPKNYWDGCTDKFRPFGANHFILMKCGFKFTTNVFDDAEWTAAITSGDIVVSPPGTLTQQAPTQSVVEVEGCRRQIAGDLTYIYDFTTLQTGDNCSDYDFWNKLFLGSRQYRILFIHCDCRIEMENDWIDGMKAAIETAAGGDPTYKSDATSPGFEFSVTTAPYIAENTDLRVEQWTTQFQIKRNPQDGIIKAICEGVEDICKVFA